MSKTAKLSPDQRIEVLEEIHKKDLASIKEAFYSSINQIMDETLLECVTEEGSSIYEVTIAAAAQGLELRQASFRARLEAMVAEGKLVKSTRPSASGRGKSASIYSKVN